MAIRLLTRKLPLNMESLSLMLESTKGKAIVPINAKPVNLLVASTLGPMQQEFPCIRRRCCTNPNDPYQSWRSSWGTQASMQANGFYSPLINGGSQELYLGVLWNITGGTTLRLFHPSTGTVLLLETTLPWILSEHMQSFFSLRAGIVPDLSCSKDWCKKMCSTSLLFPCCPLAVISLLCHLMVQ